jgi:hypothetical protein
MGSASPALRRPEAEHALFHSMWDYVSKALDHEDYDPANEQADRMSDHVKARHDEQGLAKSL